MKKSILLIVFFGVACTIWGQNVTVLTPNGGENWQIGCTNTIQWITSTPTSVKIELFSNGTLISTLAQQVPPTQNSYNWAIGYNISPGSTYKIKVTSLSNTTGFDFSDSNFSINLGSITVLTPNGGETLLWGTTYLITWNDNVCENVRIEVWKGGTFYSLLTSSTPSTGSFAWAITPNYSAGNDYKVKILSTALNSGSTTMVYDFSDANFTIGSNSNCIVTVVSPNGGEVWARGTTHLITWQSSANSNVRIELWKGGVYYTMIIQSTPNSGSFTWTIPATIGSGNNYKVKIIALNSTASNSCFDFSDNSFSILSSSNIGVIKTAELESKVYPNPCDASVSILFDTDLSNPTIKILDVTGSVLKEELAGAKYAFEPMKINTSDIPSGFYVLVVAQNDAIVLRRSLVIKH